MGHSVATNVATKPARNGFAALPLNRFAGRRWTVDWSSQAVVRRHRRRALRRVDIWHYVGTWRRLVARTVRDREAAGSNPVVPTMKSQVRGVIPLTFFFVYGHKLATSGHKQRA